MTQQTFSASRNPQVIISQVDASLSVRASQEQIISVETAAPSVGLFQEGDKLIITNCQGDLALRVPALKNSNTSITTDITAIHLSGNVTIEGAGQVKLKEIGGNVILKDIAGDTELENIHGTANLTDMWGGLRAVGMPGLFARQGIKGDVLLSHIFPIGCVTRFHVGGNATLRLADDVSLNLYAMVGGQMSVEALGYGGGGNFVNFVYGDGASRLDLLVDGDLLLLGARPLRRL